MNPSTMVGAMYNNQYIVAYRKASETALLVFARGETPELVTIDFSPTAMHIERGSGRLFCLAEADNQIYEIDADPVNKEQYLWQSKRFVNPYMTNTTHRCGKSVRERVCSGSSTPLCSIRLT